MARAWIILLASAVCEAVWATALGESDGLRQPAPSVVFAVGLLLSMLGLGRAMKRIPIGTAYAVWVGVGAALTVTWSIATGAEAFAPGKVVFIAGIVVAVIGLKLVPATPTTAARVSQASEERGTEDESGGDRHHERG
ncbi:DMT family transporter [Microbacterium arborescens]